MIQTRNVWFLHILYLSPLYLSSFWNLQSKIWGEKSRSVYRIVQKYKKKMNLLHYISSHSSEELRKSITTGELESVMVITETMLL